MYITKWYTLKNIYIKCCIPNLPISRVKCDAIFIFFILFTTNFSNHYHKGNNSMKSKLKLRIKCLLHLRKKTLDFINNSLKFPLLKIIPKK